MCNCACAVHSIQHSDECFETKSKRRKKNTIPIEICSPIQATFQRSLNGYLCNCLKMSFCNCCYDIHLIYVTLCTRICLEWMVNAIAGTYRADYLTLFFIAYWRWSTTGKEYLWYPMGAAIFKDMYLQFLPLITYSSASNRVRNEYIVHIRDFR